MYRAPQFDLPIRDPFRLVGQKIKETAPPERRRPDCTPTLDLGPEKINDIEKHGVAERKTQ